MELAKLINVDKDKCVNCHQCIAACSTKFANNGSGDYVEMNDDLCIGCGECLKACTHEARTFIDDFDLFIEAITKKQKIVAVVAPAVAASFPNQYLNLNGWLKTLGVSAFFDVSFGAELTIKSYLDYIQKKNPKTVISQPCPAIVNYMQIYLPELLPHLAPADSPMMHAMKMVKEFYPEFKNHKMLIVSPCVAKKREFDEVGIGDFNVTIHSIQKYLSENNINLKKYPEVDFDNDKAERAVLFSTPGGLLMTAEREVPEIRNKTRKIEGPHVVYKYFDKFSDQIKHNRTPLLVDCLNCDLGCNGGTGTNMKDASPDELEFLIEERKVKMQSEYKTNTNDPENHKKLTKVINKYWKPGLYDRKYLNHSKKFKDRIKTPDEKSLKKIYASMHKYSDEDIINCASCGYNSCEMMATAIHNNLNRIENCHFFLAHEITLKKDELQEKTNKVLSQKQEIIHQSESLLDFIQKIRNYIQG
ncbi:MAG: [Fe-Fe] hydrogenase large subunit C-terminal domain-containing protein [Tenuifilaceae bacterium]